MNLIKGSFVLFSASTILCQAAVQAPPDKDIPVAPVSTFNPLTVAKALGDTFATVSEKVSPAVVVINITRGDSDGDSEGGSEDQAPGPFDMFKSPHKMPMPQDPSESLGSGFIVRSDGYIYTNNHVIQGADKIKVKLKDGRIFDAQVVGIPDEKTDVAVIKINAKDLPVVEIGDSDSIRPGEWTIAIGAPFSLDYSVTVGVLSGKVRDRLGASTYEEYLQTQATINPGNSGGPLLDINGKVIGINTLIRTRPGSGFNYYNANVGFAIPIKLAQKIGNLLITKGKVERPWIGVDIGNFEDALDLKGIIKDVKKGVIVRAIRPETPAAQSDLKPGDVITAIDKTPVETARELQKQVLDKQIGQTVNLSVNRNGKILTIPVKTELQPSAQQRLASHSSQPKSTAVQAFGISVQAITPELAEQYSLTEKQGVFVIDVDDNSFASRSGVIPGMVITEIDGKKVNTPPAFRDILKKADLKRGVMVQAERDGIRTFFILKSGRSPEPLQKEE